MKGLKTLQPALLMLPAALLLLPPAGASAATPSSGSVDGSRPAAWDFAPVSGDSVTGGPVEDNCPPTACDSYTLTVRLPAAAKSYYLDHTATLLVHYTWSSATAESLDVFAYSPTGVKTGPGAPEGPSTSGAADLLIVDPEAGDYSIRSVAAMAPVPTAASAVATLVLGPRLPDPAPPPRQAGDPAFVNYTAPPGKGRSAGEPSIGADWSTGKAMFQSFTETLRVTFDDGTRPPSATWEDTASAITGTQSLDPILFVDHQTNRTFVSELAGACSASAYSDDDGNSWTPSSGCDTPAGADHQTVGGGPFAPPVVGTVYPNAFYYCSQDIATAMCGVSLDGGLTYQQGVPVYTTAQCGGLHGHIRVAPDGTAYLPNKNCGGKVGLAVSTTDSQAPWTVGTVPDSTVRGYSTDPSVAAGAANTIYYGYENGDGHPRVAVSRDRGTTWAASVDVGVSQHIKNVKFPEVIAGDDDRAAFAFLGSTTPGDAQQSNFAGTWYMYVAFTYDGGRTWTTVNATPGDPVQRGCIDNAGTLGGSCPYRNLLDFNDVTVDRLGRVLVGYADGCSKACETDPRKNSHSQVASIVRQSCGRGLFARYDPGFSTMCPAVSAAAAAPAGTPGGSPAAAASGARLPNTGRGPAPWAGLALFGLLFPRILSVLTTFGTRDARSGARPGPTR